jgi:predicted class III extradiol MEMO1 family dioxygenase
MCEPSEESFISRCLVAPPKHHVGNSDAASMPGGKLRTPDDSVKVSKTDFCRAVFQKTPILFQKKAVPRLGSRAPGFTRTDSARR